MVGSRDAPPEPKLLVAPLLISAEREPADLGGRTTGDRFLGCGTAPNRNVPDQYTDWGTGGDVGSADEIARGDGAIIRRGPLKVAVYRAKVARVSYFRLLDTGDNPHRSQTRLVLGAKRELRFRTRPYPKG